MPPKGEAMPNTPSPREQLDAMLRASPQGMSLAEVEAEPIGVDLGPLRPNLAARIRTSDKRIHAVPAPLVEELERFKMRRWMRTPGDSLRLIGRRHVRSNNSWLHNSKSVW